MKLKLPKDDERISWTKHVKGKMKFYGLSEGRLRRLLSNPKRKETGIVPETIAIMQPAGSKKHPTEIWLMYQKRGAKLRLISAWRYPAISPTNQPPPIPEDIWRDLLR